MRAIDVHQHLWPEQLIEALRARSTPPMLRGWTLYTAGEAPYEVDPAAHDIARRAEQDADCAQVLLSMSTPLGIESLDPAAAAPLLDAWHQGARSVPAPFGAWAALSVIEPDLDALKGHFTNGFVGLQIGADQLADPAAVEALAPVLECCQEYERPVLVHPGPVAHRAPGTPDWWPPVVEYVTQWQSAWWAWHAVGRSLLPTLRICFVAGGGLAAVHHERFAARSGSATVLDRDVFVDTSSYGRQGVDALTRALGIDVLVRGTDRPYAERADLHLGAAAQHAIDVVNPTRLLEGDPAR